MEESINTYYFFMNTQTAPFNDLKVRQAINYAIDPEALNRVFGGRLHPTQQILPPGMPGYEEYKLYPGPDMNKAKALIAEANPTDKDITVWTDDEPDRKRIGEYYHDLLTQLGFNATLKVIAGDVYWTTIGNQSTPDLDTGFADWFQDFPHPDDFFRPLLNGKNILPTNSNNFSKVAIPGPRRQAERVAHSSSSATVASRTSMRRLTRRTWSRRSGHRTATRNTPRSSPIGWTSARRTAISCSARTTRPCRSSNGRVDRGTGSPRRTTTAHRRSRRGDSRA